MRRTRVSVLLAITAATALVGWLVVRALEGRGVFLGPVTWVADAAIIMLAAVVGWSGLAVRSYLRGRRPSLSALRAARTLVLAKAAALTGAVLAGWYAAQVLAVLGDLAIESRRNLATSAGVAAACAVVLAVVGVVVERWCQLPPGSLEEGDEADDGASSAPTPA